MNTKPLISAVLCAAFVAPVGAADSSYRLAIDSIRVEGPDLMITAQVPQAAAQATLEVRDIHAEGMWQARQALRIVEPGIITFRIPKPEAAQFMRVRLDATDTFVGATTRELNFVPVPPLAELGRARGGATDHSGDIELEFRAIIDGSDRIELTRQGALWDHRYYQWPTDSVWLSGVEWKPEEKNVLSTVAGKTFLPAEVQFDLARLSDVVGRDTVALERSRESVIIYINDTPSGSGEYRFKLLLPSGRPRPNKAAGASATLRIATEIDGSDKLRLTHTEASWEHRHYRWPPVVQMNDYRWIPRKQPILAEEEIKKFLPEEVDFSTVRVLERRGRDVAAVEADADGITIHFADNPSGESLYELILGFGE